MLIVSVGFLRQGGMPYLVASTTYPFYMASPANSWETLILPHIPLWLRVGSTDAVQWFWEGSPQGMTVPWAQWTQPLLAWGSFTLALMAAVYCLGALVCRDWIERQRLAFPLVDVPLAMTGNDRRPTLATSLLNNRVFWMGFAVPSFLAVLAFLQRLYPSVPVPQLYNIPVGGYFQGLGLPWSTLGGYHGMTVSIVWAVIGITCLLPTEVSLSIWLFYVLYRVQLLVWGSFGVAEEGATATVAINPHLFIGFEQAGGFVALTAAILYQSRSSLRSAWRSLIGRISPDRDPYVPLSGRWALLGFIGATGFMFWWTARAGMPWWTFAPLLILFFAVALGASRLVAAGGVMYVDTGFTPRRIWVNAFGALPLGIPSLTMYAFLDVIYMHDPMNLAMPQMMNSFGLIHSGRVKGSSFSIAALTAMVVMLVVGLAAILTTVYSHGATALPYWPFTDYPEGAFAELDASLRAPEVGNNWLRLAFALGVGVTLLLTWLNANFLWWPVSPIGFLIANAYETNRSLWFSVFLAWAISTAVRRYGGLRLHRAVRPAFLGLVLGEYLTAGFLGIIASIFGLYQPIG